MNTRMVNNSIMPDYVQMAIDDGQLVYVGEEYDDDYDSPTYEQYFTLYRATKGIRYD